MKYLRSPSDPFEKFQKSVSFSGSRLGLMLCIVAKARSAIPLFEPLLMAKNSTL